MIIIALGFDVATGALTNLTVKAGDWPALRGPGECRRLRA
jgi:hypothetical protein